MDTIEQINAREILSGTGRPTVEVALTTGQGIQVTASVPSGTSKGKYEACELYDGGERYRGFGVRKAVENVNKYIAPAVTGMDVTNQRQIDKTLLELDGTENKSRLGANAILAVSLASVKAGAQYCYLPYYRYLGGAGAKRLPVPIATVIAGGKFAASDLDFEDYILIPQGFFTFSEAVEALVESRITLGEVLDKRFGKVADTGGALSPPLDSTTEAFDLMLESVEKAGFAGKMAIGLDAAASELYHPAENIYRVAARQMSTAELTEYYVNLTKAYPLEFIEDAFAEDDFDAFSLLTKALPDKKIVGDDLFATNMRRIKKGIKSEACNSLLLKINQAGTISEAYDAAMLAQKNHYSVIVSVRSNDTNDSFIADLAVAIHAEQIKLGSPVRAERNAKYNRLLAIEQELGKQAIFAAPRHKEHR